MDAVLVKNADRMMMAASVQDDGIALSFADGCKGVVPFAEFPEVRGRASLSAIELPNPYEMILETVAGERIEIPWDFARHYCDESYRPTVEAIAMQGRQTLGERSAASGSLRALPRRRLHAQPASAELPLYGLRTGSNRPDTRL